MRYTILFAMLAVMPRVAVADVTLPRIFTDHMVLQHGAAAPVWGKADPGETVTVVAAGQTHTTVAGEDGHWRVTLDPIESDAPIELTISGKNTIAIRDVLIGEVWVCSGQSNMEWPVRMSANPEEEIAAADWPAIRFFNVSEHKHPARTEQWDVDPKVQWQVCSPQTVAKFSAVGYFFGRHLHKELGRPIGLINVSWGGMPAEAFTDQATLKSDAAFRSILDNWSAAMAEYPKKREEYERALKDWEFAAEEAKKKGEKEPAKPRQPTGPDSPSAPSALWNSMIRPIIPYAIRGAIWYQGETNAPRAHQYRKLLPAMINNWRDKWEQGAPGSLAREFPFLIVQLANYRAAATEPAEPSSDWALLREAQAMTLESVPNTGLAVTIDIGDEKDIHPKNKQDVGRRLALAAEKIAYGRDITFSGPVYKSMKVEGRRAVLTFDHVGGGLTARGDKLEGFAVAGSNGVWHAGEAVIEGDNVIVTSREVESPVAVRYAWANNPRATLYNKDGLPAVPFRTDRD